MSVFLGVAIGIWIGWLATFWWFKSKEEEYE